MFLFSLTQSSNFKNLICFLYSLRCINAYVESAFSKLKHLLNDKKNCMKTKFISHHLKIRLNSTLPSIQIYEYLLGHRDLLKALKSDENSKFKRKCVQ